MNFMNRIFLLLALLAAGGINGFASPALTNTAAENRVLLIGPSSMPMSVGKATLIIGPLQRVNGVFTGDYKLKVFPYFFKSEAGRLAIVVSDASLAGAAQGRVAVFTGTATTNGKGGRSRQIEATATPVDNNRGALKVCFMAGDRKMIFTPAYHFVGPAAGAVLAQTTQTNLTTQPPRLHPGKVAAVASNL